MTVEPGHLSPRTRRVRNALAAAGDQGLTTDELAEVGGFRFGARLHELSEAGYTIAKTYISRSNYRYRLIRPTAPLDAHQTYRSAWWCMECAQPFNEPVAPCPACGTGLLIRVVIPPAAEQAPAARAA